MPLNSIAKNLVECTVCRRQFEESRIRKHQEICKMSMKMKRKPFDSFSQRIRGTVLEKHLDSIKARLQLQTSTKMYHGNWRKAHEEFISTVKAAKISQSTSNESEKHDPCTPSLHEYQLPAM